MGKPAKKEKEDWSESIPFGTTLNLDLNPWKNVTLIFLVRLIMQMSQNSLMYHPDEN